MTERLHFHFSLPCIGEGNGNPLQCSCLENPRDGGAWWAALYGVTQSQTWLKWLSSSSMLAVFREGNGNPFQYSCLESPVDGGAQWASIHGVAESGRTEWLHFHFSLSCIGEGNGNLLQCSCLENPRDGGPWWAAVYGVAQSRTQLMWLSSSNMLAVLWLFLCNKFLKILLISQFYLDVILFLLIMIVFSKWWI